MSFDGEAFAGHHQPAPAAVERVVFVATMTEGLVLHPASALVQRDVREVHDVIRIGDLHRCGEHRVEHHPIRTGQVQRRPAHPVTPRLRSGGEPGAHRDDLRPGNNIEQLAVFHVNDLGRPALLAVAALTLVERLVQTNRGDRRVPGRIIDQHLALAVIPRRCPAPGTVRSRRPRLDLDPQPRRPLANPEDRDVGQANKQRAHARRIGIQQGLLDTGRSRTPSALQSPCPAPGTPTPPSDPKRRIWPGQRSVF